MTNELTLAGDRPLEEIFSPLTLWYRASARALPWRQDATPYHVWLSEVMLQQTRIEAVRPYYARFLAEAPDIRALATLPDDRLMKLWEGLGYYSRARNLKRAACVLVEQYGGDMPRDHAAIRALPGIGDYTAGAIASIAFDLPYPAVDGNVLRVLSRLTADRADVMAPATRKRATERLSLLYAATCRASGDAATFTQALMELGEVLCLPNRAPLCGDCPLATLCRAREEGCAAALPVRSAKKAKKDCYKLMLLLFDAEGRYALCRRPEEGLLGGMWELPHVELSSPPPTDEETLDRLAHEFCEQNGLLSFETAPLPQAKHVFTHLVWWMQGRLVNVQKTKQVNASLVFLTPADIARDYALPAAFSAYVNLIK